MADVRPFRGLRYRPDVAGDAGGYLAPPYDVIDADEQAALHERSPYNVVRLELGEQRPEDDERSNRYTRAADTLREWRDAGVVALDEQPAFYVCVHEFDHEGKRRRRTAFFARLRLEPWEHGSVRPHEETMRAPKEDRLQLLRHLRTNVSPIFMLYRDPAGIARLLDEARPLVEGETPDGQRHSLAALDDPAAVERVSAALREQPVYVLDGHHRYETALAYREERRLQADSWSGEEPENFVMVALASIDDPGQVLLPIHRLVRPPAVPPDAVVRLERYFEVADITPKSYDGTALFRLLGRLAAAGRSGTAFGALGLEEGSLHLLTLRDVAAVQSLMPERSPTWRALDVNVLDYAVLRETLGMGAVRLKPDPQEGQGAIEYTEDAAKAHREVESGRWPLAFLLNPTRVEQMLAVADAGERMPAKSTFFYPKLATGLVMNPLE